jgi:hypothetical protein
MRIEWATNCRDVIEGPNGLDIIGLGRNGYVIESPLPIQVPCPVVVCFRPEGDEEAGVVYGLNYQVLDPQGLVIDEGHSGVEWGKRHRAPQVVEPERYYKTLEVPILVRESGQHTIELWLDGGDVIRLPYLFAAWTL